MANDRRGAGEALKEMALLAMQIASLNPIVRLAEGDHEAVYDIRGNSYSGHPIFDHEIRSVAWMIRGRRKASRMPHDDHSE